MVERERERKNVDEKNRVTSLHSVCDVDDAFFLYEYFSPSLFAPPYAESFHLDLFH